MTKCTAWVALILMLAGCSTTFRPWKLSEIREGMDQAQVVAILGDPDSIERRSGAELLHYTYLENYNPPLTSDDPYERRMGMQDRFEKRGPASYRYVVILVDGKVQDYKELSN